ncbi:hypothetical protein StoSoilA2_20940 [Arthrobacter sp. StoSoilA2]|uniref:hypothetical protein n=1 Tax=Arthrobacter sp. StoSoilA2 TaxID=2830990 RepID=UPI001CC52A16|nr:hypothetical protein [Arthrobacter sp. StoSoilA2]BCW36038.1 hypothetical protein StoSoilA2_20940 [Arthrobacter sp. StoSoilA2]
MRRRHPIRCRRCEFEADDVSLPSASVSTTEARTVTPLPDGADTRTVPPLPESGDIDAGTYLVLVPGYTAPFEITVPDGWSTTDGDGLAKDDPDHPDEWGVFVGWWPAGYVPTDACVWQDALVKVDPSAEAFVNAITAQTSTASTPPVKVVVGDYSGVEFDLAVEGDVDIKACDRGKFCIHSEFSNECSRWYSSAAERETYRVVDLNGQRAVSWVVQFHESIKPELTREARGVFDSIVFRSGK